MNRKIIIISVLFVLMYGLPAQNTVENILMLVEKNNTTLSAYSKNADAEKIGNKTGIYLQNPEIEFNYLWGNPSAIGNRTDFSVKQSFDFPTAYKFKNQISDLKNEQAEVEYKKQRNEILFQARVVCAKLVYHNALKIELEKRLGYATKIADAYKTKYNAGDSGILDYNKAQINLLNVTNEMQNNEIERNTLLSELKTLNGGNPIAFTENRLLQQAVPVAFDEWISQNEDKNPLLQWVKQEIAISENQVKLNTAKSLPKFYAGYMSEKVVGQQFQGISAGISVPLWENKNTVKQARAQTIALKSLQNDARLHFFNNMKATHSKVITLQNNVTGFRNKLAQYNSSELLEKAFNKGEISLTEYMYELSLYYESIHTLLDMEMNLNVALAELNRYQ